jgi:hypothetical protein
MREVVNRTEGRKTPQSTDINSILPRETGSVRDLNKRSGLAKTSFRFFSCLGQRNEAREEESPKRNNKDLKKNQFQREMKKRVVVGGGGGE